MACYMFLLLSICLFSNAIGHPTDQSEGRSAQGVGIGTGIGLGGNAIVNIILDGKHNVHRDGNNIHITNTGVATKDQLYKRPTPTEDQLYKRPTPTEDQLYKRPTPTEDQLYKRSRCSDASWILDQSTGFCYTIIEQDLTWDEARLACRAKSDFDGRAELAFIRNQQEQEFITTNLLQTRSCPGNWYDFVCGVWIGLRDTVGDNRHFEWSTKFPVTYTNWLPGEPSTTYERCTAQQTLGTYQWWDSPCDAKRPALCLKTGI